MYLHELYGHIYFKRNVNILVFNICNYFKDIYIYMFALLLFVWMYIGEVFISGFWLRNSVSGHTSCCPISRSFQFYSWMNDYRARQLHGNKLGFQWSGVSLLCCIDVLKELRISQYCMNTPLKKKIYIHIYNF